MSDNPRVRLSLLCPLCYGDKPKGCVACWQCYREQGLKYGNAKAEATISGYERRLEQAEKFARYNQS
jgi:hypothetical protein